MKSKLESLFVILIMLLSIANIKICTDAIMRLNDNTEKMYITQGEIKSKQYLVTDEYISRISPKTEVESFVMQLGLENKEIAIYEDENKAAEIKEGLISTGMIMTVRNPREEVGEEIENTGEENINGSMQEENSEVENTEEPQETDYKLSVVGDINQDGRANIVEVVQIINHIVGLEGKEIEGIRLVSSDVNGDQKVDIGDVCKLIKYIVFEELEIGEVGAPKEPTIEVEAQENNGWYKEDTKVSIVTEEEEFEKTVYSIDGEKFETTSREEEKTIKQEGTHEIEAYTYGTSGNKSIVAEKEVKIDKQGPTIENINKTPEGETTGAVKIEIVAKDNLSGIEEEGYSFDGGATWQKENNKEYTDNVEEIKIQVKDIAGNITEETISIDNIVPEKLKYEVVFKNYDGTVLQTEKVEEGNVPEYKAPIPVKAEDNTYTYEFIGWDKEILNATENVEYVAEFKAIYKNYTVVFKNEDGKEIIRKEDYHYGDTVEVPDAPTKQEDNTYTYKFTGWDKEITEVEGNVEYTAKYGAIYKNYTVVFKNEDGSVISIKEDYHYGDIIDVPTVQTKEEGGYKYTFNGWKIDNENLVEVDRTVIQNREYVANYMKELVEYSITYNLNGGVLEEGKENPTTYNVETETFTLNNPIKENCIFEGWILNDEEIATTDVRIEKGSKGNRTYLAKWRYKDSVENLNLGKQYSSIRAAMEDTEFKNGNIIQIIVSNLSEDIVIDKTKEVTIDLNGCTLTNKTEGVSTITNDGILTIVDRSTNKEGIIVSTDSTAITNNGTLTLGQNDNETLDMPYINGKEIGLVNKGTFNFYDGKIEGKSALSGEGKIEEIATNYSATIEETGERQTLSLAVLADKVAKVESTKYAYASLKEAIDTLINEEGKERTETITLLKDTVIPGEMVIPEYINLKLDLNGNKIETGKCIFENNGKLEITDSSEEKSGVIESGSATKLLQNNEGAILTISSGNLEIKTNSTSNCLIENLGELNISNGNLKVNGELSTCIKNRSIANISGGTIVSAGYRADSIDNYKTLNVNGGTISNSGGYREKDNWGGNAISNAKDSTLTLQGGTLSASRNAIRNDNNAALVIGTKDNNDKDINVSSAIDNRGLATINSGTFTSSINSYNSLTINGGSINSVYASDGITEINGGNIRYISNGAKRRKRC